MFVSDPFGCDGKSTDLPNFTFTSQVGAAGALCAGSKMSLGGDSEDRPSSPWRLRKHICGAPAWRPEGATAPSDGALTSNTKITESRARFLPSDAAMPQNSVLAIFSLWTARKNQDPESFLLCPCAIKLFSRDYEGGRRKRITPVRYLPEVLGQANSFYPCAQ